MGVEVEEQTRVVNLLNNKSSPITYQILGAPNEQCVKLTKAQLNCVNEQIFKMLGTWKGDTLSSREKTILIESYPSSVSMYAMGVYQLYEGGHINNYIQLDLSSFGNDMGKKEVPYG